MVRGNDILLRGIENGQSFSRKVEFFPTLYTTTNKPSKYSTLSNAKVDEIKPGTIRDTRDFIAKYENVAGFEIYGNTNYNQQYISDNYPGNISYDSDLVKVYTIDIETETEYGFPNIKTANERINLISVMDAHTKKIMTFGLKPIGNIDIKPNQHYECCNSEENLLRSFLTFWQSRYPDVITGWNIEHFDIPYIVNRINVVLGESYSKKLSPWNMLIEKTTSSKFGKTEETYSFAGIATLDYLNLYKKFANNKLESYTLDFVAEQELGENKLENPGDTFKDFYTNFWDTFVVYNMRDVELVDMLEDKLKLIDLAMNIAYQAKINYEDVYSPVKTWESIIYNYLRDQNIVIPQGKSFGKAEKYEGGFVKDPIIGMHKWVASFDLNSLYPHLIMQYNISPETLTDIKLPCDVHSLLNMDDDLSLAFENNVAVTANGWCYDKSRRGFLPALMQSMYADRSKHKKEMLKYEQQYETDKGNKTLVKEIARLNNLQLGLKILLNSAYGALANQYFKYFDLRMAEGITLSGQLSIQWMANKLNAFLNDTLKTKNKDYVIAIDTDSIYLSLEDLVETVCADKTSEQKIRYMDKICDDVFQKFIDKGYKELSEYMNAYEQKMVMKRESLADKAIFIAKKRYILNVHNSEGVQYTTPKLKVMGLELVKTSTPMICRKQLKDAIPVILEGSEKQLKQYVCDFKNSFMELPIEAIAKPSSINDITKWMGRDSLYNKGTPIHVRGAILFNQQVKLKKLSNRYKIIDDGDNIKFVYLRTPNPIQENIISFSDKLPKEFDLELYIDRDTQFKKVFLDALRIMVEPLRWNLDDSANLEDFFG
jgi:DNA polymerase elongation subunit (family B)